MLERHGLADAAFAPPEPAFGPAGWATVTTTAAVHGASRCGPNRAPCHKLTTQSCWLEFDAESDAVGARPVWELWANPVKSTPHALGFPPRSNVGSRPRMSMHLTFAEAGFQARNYDGRLRFSFVEHWRRMHALLRPERRGIICLEDPEAAAPAPRL